MRGAAAQAGAARSSAAPMRHWLTARRTGCRRSTRSLASGSHLRSHSDARRLPKYVGEASSVSASARAAAASKCDAYQPRERTFQLETEKKRGSL